MIEVRNISKCYRVGSLTGGYKTIREAILDAFRAPFRNYRQLRRLTRFEKNDGNGSTAEMQNGDVLWALRDVSFDVEQGDVVGIIGRNGAGKSTLLKILSRITDPTDGEVVMHGRVASLLEVGTGFHMELTGRENIYLNGAILGMRRIEIDEKFDEIVAFAEVERFIDTPVKRYSSGMHMRLAFSVAAHLEPEILLIDEVLAVGDIAFQKKCLGKMEDVAKQGRTVLFVSHNMGAVKGLCKKTVWIKNGEIHDMGETQKVIPQYIESSRKYFMEEKESGNEQVTIVKTTLKDGNGQVTSTLYPGDDLIVDMSYHARTKIPRPNFWISIESQHGSLICASMLLDGRSPDYIEGEGTISCRFKALPLLPQLYTVRMGVRDENGRIMLTKTRDVGYFYIQGKMSDFGFDGNLADVLSWDSAPMIIPYQWQLPERRTIDVSLVPQKTSQEKV